MKKGDIILIPFPFTDLTGLKNRPAIILVESELDLIVSFITTQIKWQEETDINLTPSEENGLKKVSLLKLNKLATLDKELIIGRLGTINKETLYLINKNLIKIFQLDKKTK